MKVGIKKFLGWLLFAGGIAIIFWSLYYSYQIFDGKKNPPLIFKAEKGSVKNSKISSHPSSKEIENLINEKIKEVLPAEDLIKLLNLVSWSIFVFILIFAGTQISSLGIKLIK